MIYDTWRDPFRKLLCHFSEGKSSEEKIERGEREREREINKFVRQVFRIRTECYKWSDY